MVQSKTCQNLIKIFLLSEEDLIVYMSMNYEKYAKVEQVTNEVEQTIVTLTNKSIKTVVLICVY